jgi:hypothetical protein
MRCIDLSRYLFFRDMGLRGRLPDGTEDSKWRGRNGKRNALLVTTGLRLTEGDSLLPAELPRRIAPGRRSVLFDLSGLIAKGRWQRQIRIPRRVLALIQDYIELGRAVSSARSEPSVTNPFWLARLRCTDSLLGLYLKQRLQGMNLTSYRAALPAGSRSASDRCARPLA